MRKKRQIQFTIQQMQQLDKPQPKTAIIGTEMVRRAVDYYKHEIGGLLLEPALRPSPTGEAREVPRPLRADPPVTSTHLPRQKKRRLFLYTPA